MSNVIQGMTDAFRLSLLTTYFGANTINIALYGPTASISNTTSAYTPTGEIVSTGYTAGGKALTGQAIVGATGLAWVQWSNPTWTLATSTAVQGCMIYNVSQANQSILILNFGAPQFPLASGVFTIVFPPNPSLNAVLRLA